MCGNLEGMEEGPKRSVEAIGGRHAAAKGGTTSVSQKKLGREKGVELQNVSQTSTDSQVPLVSCIKLSGRARKKPVQSEPLASEWLMERRLKQGPAEYWFHRESWRSSSRRTTSPALGLQAGWQRKGGL